MMALALSACSDPPPQAKSVPVPALGPRTTLRMVHAVNARFPTFSRAQLDVLTAEASAAAKRLYGIDVDFVLVGEIDIETLFRSISADLWKAAQYSAYDFK